MIGHYLRVQDAAELLGVSPVTVRWYSQQGWLPTYRVGRGRVSHRRFKYGDVTAVARRTGRFIPDEPRWDQASDISLEMAAQYLGLSSRYLVDSGWLEPGVRMKWSDLSNLECRIYPEPDGAWNDKNGERGLPMLGNAEEQHCGCGGHGGHGSQGGMRGRMQGRRGPGWEQSEVPSQEASLLALRRAKRHLEAKKADLEDQIQDLEQRIAKHPDNGQ
ncbi:MAG: helix-turn-helix domain-containing protein [Firmicutes bacterium]|nr:helix-turn-helix domain-containing protein [Bacillota bacterium]